MIVGSHLAPLSVFLGACVSLATVLGVLALMSWRHRRHLAAVPFRIHVAGSRGKSTTVRLIAAALRAHGLRVVAKTTGTRPRLIRCDGAEEDWPRRGPASIREQASFFARAARERAEVAVVECMAIRPEMIAASERQFVCATTVVITNTRADHQEDLATEDGAMAASLVHAVPHSGQLVISDEVEAKVFRTRAERANTAISIVATASADPLEANRLIAAAVAEAHGVPASTQRKAFATAAPDPDAFSLHEVTIGGRRIAFANAFSCNDVESFERLWRARSDTRPAVILFNARYDRPLRTRAFLTTLARLDPRPHVFFHGGGRQLLTVARRAGLALEKTAILPTSDPCHALEILAAAAEDGAQIWGIGNYRGLGAALIDHLAAARPC